MSDVIFCKTRYNYDSYKDFWRLVEVSGFPSIYVDELDPDDSSKCYICTPLNGEWQHGWNNPKARIINWDLEWRLDGVYPVIPGVSETWASDVWYARKVGLRYVTLGSHSGLVHNQNVFEDKVYDVALMSYLTNRRLQVVNELRSFNITLTPNAWDHVRDTYLKQTRLMAHIHQRDDAHTIAPLRWALAAAYKLPMVCEQVHEYGIYFEVAFWEDHHRMSLLINRIIKDLPYHSLAEKGLALHHLLCNEYPFRKCVEAAL